MEIYNLMWRKCFLRKAGLGKKKVEVVEDKETNLNLLVFLSFYRKSFNVLRAFESS